MKNHRKESVSQATGNDELKIRISGLSTGTHEYHLTTVPAALNLPENFTREVVVDARLVKNPRQIVLHVDLGTGGKFECDRCLEAFQRELKTSYDMVYLYEDSEAAQYAEEDVDLISPDTTHINLTDDVRQMAALSVPMKLLCRDECKGLCPHCGTNLNNGDCTCRSKAVDPRWNELQKLMK
jgi:uncharacterized protein